MSHATESSSKHKAVAGNVESRQSVCRIAPVGIQAPKVTQAEFEGGLRGYQALEDIPPFQELVSVPRSATLVVMPNQRRPSNSVGAEYWETAPW